MRHSGLLRVAAVEPVSDPAQNKGGTDEGQTVKRAGQEPGQLLM